MYLVLPRDQQAHLVFFHHQCVAAALHAPLRVHGCLAVHRVIEHPHPHRLHTVRLPRGAVLRARAVALDLRGPPAFAEGDRHVREHRFGAANPVLPQGGLGAHAGQYFLHVEVDQVIRPASVVFADRDLPHGHGRLHRPGLQVGDHVEVVALVLARPVLPLRPCHAAALHYRRMQC